MQNAYHKTLLGVCTRVDKVFLKKKKNYTAQRKEKHYGLLMSQLFSQSRQME